MGIFIADTPKNWPRTSNFYNGVLFYCDILIVPILKAANDAFPVPVIETDFFEDFIVLVWLKSSSPASPPSPASSASYASNKAY